MDKLNKIHSNLYDVIYNEVEKIEYLENTMKEFFNIEDIDNIDEYSTYHILYENIFSNMYLRGIVSFDDAIFRFIDNIDSDLPDSKTYRLMNIKELNSALSELESNIFTNKVLDKVVTIKVSEYLDHLIDYVYDKNDQGVVVGEYSLKLIIKSLRDRFRAIFTRLIDMYSIVNDRKRCKRIFIAYLKPLTILSAIQVHEI